MLLDNVLKFTRMFCEFNNAAVLLSIPIAQKLFITLHCRACSLQAICEVLDEQPTLESGSSSARAHFYPEISSG
jgi:hypothetical protein